jgi:uncharacterized protein YndB with AHSA1/START domain
MGTYHWQFTARIEGSPPDTIFNLITDMPNYRRWLARSIVFDGITEVSPYPVRLGTTYLDAGPLGQRPGTITRYEPPEHLDFHLTMPFKQGRLIADLDIQIHYTLEPIEHATHVIRDYDLTIRIPGLVRVVEPLVAYEARRENARILRSLKHYVESHPG